MKPKKMQIIQKSIFILLFSFWGTSVFAGDSIFPDRRRSQFPNQPGHAVAPYVYNLPGIGSGLGILAAMTNIGGSFTDVSGTGFFGDVTGQVGAIDSIHIIRKKLFFDIAGANLSNATIQSYSQRGMATEKEDYTLAEFTDSFFGGSRLTATFMERRFEIYFGYYEMRAQLKALRDRDGEVIVETEDAPKGRFHTTIYGTRFDFTDDMQDPRRGARFDASLWRRPRVASGPNYFIADYSATAYVAVGKRNTWAFNYFKSDAHVLEKGETDSTVIEDELGFDLSSITDPAEQTRVRQYIDTAIAHNKYGTASSLGGYGRLRSYSEGRFSGAHTEFLGTEFRWNLTDEFKPFNIYIMRDIRTAVQIAFFYEIGTVADTYSGLWCKTRSSYGTGFRLVTASGIVYRIDIAGGQEGFQPSVFFQYPWELL